MFSLIYIILISPFRALCWNSPPKVSKCPKINFLWRMTQGCLRVLFCSIRNLCWVPWDQRSGSATQRSLKAGTVPTIVQIVSLPPSAWYGIDAKLLTLHCWKKIYRTKIRRSLTCRALTEANLIYNPSVLNRGRKEMSSILADQKRPRIWAQLQGWGVAGSPQPMSQWVQRCTWSVYKLWRSNSIINVWFWTWTKYLKLLCPWFWTSECMSISKRNTILV